MGLEDRQYYRSEYEGYPGSFGGRTGGHSMVNILLMINIAVFVADMFSPQVAGTQQGLISHYLALPSNVAEVPWRIYGLLTFGFTHASWSSETGVWHILMNMFVLWMFGREVEMRLGRYEFLRYYLAAVLLTGLVWLLYVNLVHGGSATLVGASGAVMAVFALFVFFDPKRTLLIWGIVPAPAWLLCGLYVFFDILGMHRGGNVAHEAHLAGVAFAAAYFYLRLNLGQMLPGRGRFRLPRFGRPALRVHRGETATEDPEASYRQLEEEGDRILQKINSQGEESLTAKERETLERYSRRMRQKHR